MLIRKDIPNPYFSKATSYVTKIKTIENQLFNFCYFLGDISPDIEGLSSRKYSPNPLPYSLIFNILIRENKGSWCVFLHY